MLLALGPATAGTQCGEWEWQSPLPMGNWLYGVWGSDGSNVYAMGDAGTSVHYYGAVWSPMSSGTTE